MKMDIIVIMSAAAVGLLLLNKSLKTTVAPVRAGGNASSLNNNGAPPTVQVVNTALPGQPGWGWAYYSDGTAISPAGEYYFQGQKVYG